MTKKPKNLSQVVTPKPFNNKGFSIENLSQVVTPIQEDLFEVEATNTIDGIEMGVFSDGTPFLSQRGLQAFCGLTNNGIISNLSKEWEDYKGGSEDIIKNKPRLSFINQLLQNSGYDYPSLYIKTTHKGNDVYAYPDVVCMAILEYYAFEIKPPVSVAVDRYRKLAKQSFRFFVYELVGYKPRTEELDKWRYFLDRVNLNFNNPPEGYFSIFQEMVKPIHVLISNGLIVTDKTIPDQSAGICWGREWTNNKLEESFGKRVKYDHNFPDYYPQALSNPQHPWAYPEDALPYFRKWFRETYMTSKFPSYLENKVKSLELKHIDKNNILGALGVNKQGRD